MLATRFFSELWMLFREMYGFEILMFAVFFPLGLWLMWAYFERRAERVRAGLEEQGRLREAVVALRKGVPEDVTTPVPRSKGARDTALEGSFSEAGSAAGNPMKPGLGKLFQETETAASEWLAGASSEGAEGEDSGESGAMAAAEDVTEKVRSARDESPHLSGDELADRIRPATSADGTGKGSKKRKEEGEIAGSTSTPPALTSYEEAMGAFDEGDKIGVDRELGILFSGEPDSPDDLKKIKGIGPKIESQLREAGVFRYAQIAHWNPYNVEAFEKHLKFTGRVEREEWVAQAKSLASSAEIVTPGETEEPDGEDFSGKDSGVDLPLPKKSDYAKAKAGYKTEPVEIDRKLGIIYPHRPGLIDDLTEISGVGPGIREKLNGDGVFRFRQIAQWNDYNIAEFNRRLRFNGRIERDQWIPQAKKLATRSARDAVKAGKQIRRSFAGECVTVKPGIGIVYLDAPAKSEDLSKLAGVGAGIAKKLQALGIYRFKQIALWGEANAAAADVELGLEEGTSASWRNEAQSLAARVDAEGEKAAAKSYRSIAEKEFRDEDVTVDEKLGILFERKPEDPDDLTRIKGIGKVLSGRLNDFGVYRFQQIAHWNEFTVRAFTKRLKSFQDRVYRDRWIEQAAQFHRGEGGE